MAKAVADSVVSKADLAAAIQQEYHDFNIPADQIVIDPELSAQFANRVSQRLGLESCLDVTLVNQRLLNERKRGHLARLERDFNGRNVRVNKPR